MKKTIPFKKQLTFKTNVSEITSISLENTLKNNNSVIEGDLIVSGTYKITDKSITVDNFEFRIPINIEVDDKYILEDVIIDIDDFYYEIINNNILEVNIEILLNNIVEKQTEFENETKNKEEQMEENQTIIKDDRCIEAEIEEETKETQTEEKTQNNKKELNNIFDNFSNDKETYSTYHIYIVREGDNAEVIMSKYNISREKLEEYNNLNELKIGDKIIIPEIKNAGN